MGGEAAFIDGLLGRGAPEGADGHAMGDARFANCRGHSYRTVSRARSPTDSGTALLRTGSVVHKWSLTSTPLPWQVAGGLAE